jgi:hypothetical protein
MFPWQERHEAFSPPSVPHPAERRRATAAADTKTALNIRFMV